MNGRLPFPSVAALDQVTKTPPNLPVMAHRARVVTADALGML